MPGRASLPVEGRGPLTSPVQSRRARRCYSYQAEPLAKLHPRHERDLASDLQASAPVAPRIREQILQERIPPQISAIKIPPQTPLPIHFPSPLPWVPHQDPRETHPMQVGNYRGGVGHAADEMRAEAPRRPWRPTAQALVRRRAVASRGRGGREVHRVATDRRMPRGRPQGARLRLDLLRVCASWRQRLLRLRRWHTRRCRGV